MYLGYPFSNAGNAPPNSISTSATPSDLAWSYCPVLPSWIHSLSAIIPVSPKLTSISLKIWSSQKSLQVTNLTLWHFWDCCFGKIRNRGRPCWKCMKDTTSTWVRITNWEYVERAQEEDRRVRTGKTSWEKRTPTFQIPRQWNLITPFGRFEW